jgi:hypothetical protein
VISTWKTEWDQSLWWLTILVVTFWSHAGSQSRLFLDVHVSNKATALLHVHIKFVSPLRFYILWVGVYPSNPWIRKVSHTKTSSLKGRAIFVTGHGGPKSYDTLRLPHFLDNRLTDGGEVVTLTRCRPLPPGRFLVLISDRGWVDPRAIVRLKGLGQLKIPVTPSGLNVNYISNYANNISYVRIYWY